VGFVVDEVLLGHVPVRVIRFTPAIIPPLLNTHLHVHVAHYQKDERLKPGNFQSFFGNRLEK